MKKIAIVALLASFVAAPALAANTGKAYVAGDLGFASYSNVGPYPNPGMVRIAGGYHFNPMLAAEIGYTSFADSTFGYGTLSASSFQVAGVLSLPINAKFDLLGKLGMANNSAKETNYYGYYASYSQSSLMFGVGAQYHLDSQLSIRAQYEDYGNFQSYSPAMKATTVSLGVAYNF